MKNLISQAQAAAAADAFWAVSESGAIGLDVTFPLADGGLNVSFVADGQVDMLRWINRGPLQHLRYQTIADFAAAHMEATHG